MEYSNLIRWEEPFGADFRQWGPWAAVLEGVSGNKGLTWHWASGATPRSCTQSLGKETLILRSLLVRPAQLGGPTSTRGFVHLEEARAPVLPARAMHMGLPQKAGLVRLSRWVKFHGHLESTSLELGLLGIPSSCRTWWEWLSVMSGASFWLSSHALGTPLLEYSFQDTQGEGVTQAQVGTSWQAQRAQPPNQSNQTPHRGVKEPWGDNLGCLSYSQHKSSSLRVPIWWSKRRPCPLGLDSQNSRALTQRWLFIR